VAASRWIVVVARQGAAQVDEEVGGVVDGLEVRPVRPDPPVQRERVQAGRDCGRPEPLVLGHRFVECSVPVDRRDRLQVALVGRSRASPPTGGVAEPAARPAEVPAQLPLFSSRQLARRVLLPHNPG